MAKPPATTSPFLIARVSVSSAELLALPMELVAAPGAGKMISVIDLKAIFRAGTVAYAGSASIGYPNREMMLLDINNVTDGVTFGNVEASIGTAAQLVSVYDNQPVELHGGLTGGDGTFVIDLAYRVIDL